MLMLTHLLSIFSCSAHVNTDFLVFGRTLEQDGVVLDL